MERDNTIVAIRCVEELGHLVESLRWLQNEIKVELAWFMLATGEQKKTPQ